MSVPALNNEQGRPPLVHRDRERAGIIINAIKEGETTTMAAQSGGIARRTLYEWLYKGQEVRAAREDNPDTQVTPYDEDYLWFLLQYELAEHSRKKDLLGRIEDAGKDPRKWQANAWLLERLHPEEFSLRSTLQVTSEPEDRKVFTLNIGRPHPQRQNGGADVEEADYEIVE
jgi:hypothetical protein